MDREKRLLDNLDEIDKHIATAAMTLFLISLLYIAMLLNISAELKIPGIDLKLPKAHALFRVPINFNGLSIYNNSGISDVTSRRIARRNIPQSN
jgi:hypothetical protein